MEEEIIKKTAEYVKEKLSGEKSGHDWWHIHRVWQIGKKIASIEKADIFVVELICLLHDISDYKLNRGDKKVGLKITKDWLEKQSVDEKRKNSIIEAISKMSFKGIKSENKSLSLEGKCAQDADRLDAIGAIGIARCFTFGGFNGNIIHDPLIYPKINISKREYEKLKATSINHFHEKLLFLKDRMNTKTAKEMAEKKHKFMKIFLEIFFEEWNFFSKTYK